MVPSPRQCPGVVGKVCNRFLPAKKNDPQGLAEVRHMHWKITAKISMTSLTKSIFV